MVAAGVAAPLVRKRIKAPPIVTQAVAFAAPFGLCVAVRRSRTRDVATCALQMWAYLAAYKSPHDDPDAQERECASTTRSSSIACWAWRAADVAPAARARARGPDGPDWRTLDRVLVWAHWMWFMVPHGSLVYILLRHRASAFRARR